MYYGFTISLRNETLRTVIDRQWRLWSSLRETSYLLASPRNAEMLLAALAEIEAYKKGNLELVEVEFENDCFKRRS
jgi:PHD/YefM family antitoxin component YafN of YafNO toxin-antitoxin module